MEYGTAKFYADLFADILADVGNYETVDRNVEQGLNIIAGFKMALEEWNEYHKTSSASYEALIAEFIKQGS